MNHAITLSLRYSDTRSNHKEKRTEYRKYVRYFPPNLVPEDDIEPLEERLLSSKYFLSHRLARKSIKTHKHCEHNHAS